MIVLYDSTTMDGFGAGFCAWLKFGDKAEYVTSLTGVDCSQQDVYLFGRSDNLEALKGVAKSVTRLDPSNCRLAWEHFFTPELPMLIAHIDDRQGKIAGTAEYLAMLDLMRPWTFDQWKAGITQTKEDYVQTIAQGRIAVVARQKVISEAMNNSRDCVICGQTGLSCNSPVFVDDLANRLAVQGGTYGMVWCLQGDGLVRVELRGKDASALARECGGDDRGFFCSLEELSGLL